MTTIKCPQCHQEFEISQALEHDIEQRVVEAERTKFDAELNKVRAEVQKTAAAEAAAKLEFQLKTLETEAASEKEQSRQLREQLSKLMDELREERRARENAELAARQKLAQEESRIREAAAREADERQRLNLAAKEKTIADLQKALDEAQRKAAQGSQQLQGEVLELDLEVALGAAFRDDLIAPVAKGTRGGDITQTVRSPRGADCGLMIWEIKRTKHWTDAWIPKLKEDVRNAKAHVAIIVTEAMPKEAEGEIAFLDGVWLCKPDSAVILGTLLRKSLLDVTRQRVLDENRSTSAEALYNFVTSHEFVQQIELMVETYHEMTGQVAKERVAYEKFWALREKQAQRLLMSTANIIGSMQGHIGQASMPRIRGIELLDSGEDI